VAKLRSSASKLVCMAAVLACPIALAAASHAGAASATAAGNPTVTIRIEGASRTLLPATTVHTQAGSITADGAPAGACPGTSAAGALQAATRGGWSGSWSTTYNDYLITTILGETESGSPTYWDILVNNVAATTGACEIQLHSGDQLLFAAVGASDKGYPLAIEAPSRVKKGHTFRVRVVYYDAKGQRRALAGAMLAIGRHSGKTNARGVITMTGGRRGVYMLRASATGYIRAESTLRVVG
jgi:Domain of unknown function (DUF4430)